jgi:hypothetical protein
LLFVPILVAARIRGIERRTIARLRDAGADTAERAILLEPGGRLAQWVYRRLQRAQALRPDGSDRYYLYGPGYDAFRQRRRRRALFVLSAVFITTAILFLAGVLS